ncbi:VOC family protein [Alphaproteobacteria bacterium]|nr:VOC family protein [Alphaproteobacteria bacterium]
MHKLDHIVIAANTLEEGTSYLENKLHIKLSNIGYHKDMGTHNRVVKISKSVYLEVISIDPNCKQIKSKRWFNLDSSKLQSQLRKSPRVIGYVIENTTNKILKYYEPFFRASRDEYKWKFAMPSNNSNISADQFYQNAIIPSLINWEGEKPINKMQDNHLNLEKLEILLTENHSPYKNFIKSLGAIEKLEFSIIKQGNNSPIESYPKLKINIEDKIRDTIIIL